MSAKKSSLITSCPACFASFYVTPEQLSAHRGEVRCGKCSHIFNALDWLGESAEVVIEIDTETAAKAPAELDVEVEMAESLPSTSSSSNVASDFNITDFSTKPSGAADSPKAAAALASKTRLKQPQGRKFTGRVLALVMFVFTLLAAAQLIYHMRTQIVSRWPILKPHLQLACNFLGCTVELPKQIELLTIDDSALQEDVERQGLIHLSSAIINNASFAQAYPLLELTLTDTYDKPLLRRAFTPREYLPAGADVNRGVAAGEEIRIRLALLANEKAVAGYRVFVTYP